MKKNNVLNIVVFTFAIFFLAIYSLLLPDKVFSSAENRNLQQIPKLTFDAYISGRFSKEATDYVSDQLCLRDVFFGLKSTVQRTCGQKDIDGVYLGKDGYYLEKITDNDFNKHQFEKNLKHLNVFFTSRFSNADAKHCNVMLVPSAETVLSDKLPKNAFVYNAADCYTRLATVLNRVNIIDVRKTFLKNKDNYIFYKTDHHWTSYGAYLAYVTWCERQNIKPCSENEEQFTKVSNSFRGTLFSKVLLPDSAYDTISVSEKDTPAAVTCDGVKTAGFYQMNKLSQKDQYAVFFGGNYGLVQIQTNSTNGKHLLVIKDSFANCFIPLIANQYEKVTMADLRYYNGSVDKLMNDSAITDVLVLYEMSSFANDSNLYKLAY